VHARHGGVLYHLARPAWLAATLTRRGPPGGAKRDDPAGCPPGSRPGKAARSISCPRPA